jgi:hypothetical protein
MAKSFRERAAEDLKAKTDAATEAFAVDVALRTCTVSSPGQALFDPRELSDDEDRRFLIGCNIHKTNLEMATVHQIWMGITQAKIVGDVAKKTRVKQRLIEYQRRSQERQARRNARIANLKYDDKEE